MEGEPSGYGRSQLVDVLAEGEEQVKLLQSHLDDPFGSELCKSLVEKIQLTFGTAISMATESQLQLASPNNTGSGSPNSAMDSPRSESSDRAFKGHERREQSKKKRKALPKWTKQVRVCSESGFESQHHDGYNWRKYGQKGILGAKHVRGYFRCTHIKQGCVAKKQVQRSDDDPFVFDITYQGVHSCKQRPRTLPSPATQRNHHLGEDKHLLQQQDQQLVSMESEEQQDPSSSTFSFQSTLNPDINLFYQSEMDDHLIGGFNPAFVPTATGTSDSNYFSSSPYQMGNFGGGQSDLSDVVTIATSSVNASIVNMDFLLDPAELDANIPFDPSNFFPRL